LRGIVCNGPGRPLQFPRAKAHIKKNGTSGSFQFRPVARIFIDENKVPIQLTESLTLDWGLVRVYYYASYANGGAVDDVFVIFGLVESQLTRNQYRYNPGRVKP
jgi:hypothetical protein